MPPVYEYSVVVKLGDGKTKKEKRYKYDFKKVADGVTYHKRQQGFLARDEAIAAEFQARQELQHPSEKKEVITMDDLFKQFIAMQRTKLKPTTIVDYEFIFSKYFDIFKNRYIHTLTAKELRKWKNSYIEMNFSERHTNKIILLMSKLIEFGIKRQYEANANLLEELEPVRKNLIPKERIAWSMEEVERFFASFNMDDE